MTTSLVKWEIFKKEVNVVVELERVDPGVSDLTLKIVYQGCAESGICYMPEQKTVTVTLPALFLWSTKSNASAKCPS